MTGHKLRIGRKNVKQQLRQFVSESDDDDYAIMNLSSRERFPIRRSDTRDVGGKPHGYHPRHR